MFGLLQNLYKYIKKKNERKITVVLLGLDGSGKTTLLNALQGNGQKETTPTFGFKSETLREGKYTVEFYDLGGGKNIRKIWKNYLADIHGAIFVVDATDVGRFEEAKQVLEQVLVDPHLSEKPLVVFANKQDLPTAKAAHDVAKALGLAEQLGHPFNILPCTAKTPEGQLPDAAIRAGYKWLVNSIDTAFSRLNPRVMAEAEASRMEELRRKQEREERAKKTREERLRQQKEEQDALAARQAAMPDPGMTQLYEAKPLSPLTVSKSSLLPTVAESPHARHWNASPSVGDRTFWDVAGAVAQLGETSRGSSVAYASVAHPHPQYTLPPIHGAVPNPLAVDSLLPSSVEDRAAAGARLQGSMSFNKISPLAVASKGAAGPWPTNQGHNIV